MSKYKVLWVDDEQDNGPAFMAAASMAGLSVSQFLSWDKADAELRSHFFQWDAVILDAHCVQSEGDSPSDYFLSTAVKGLSDIFQSKGAELPWYILSAGPAKISDFDPVVRMATEFNNRKGRVADWGETVYLKYDSDATQGQQRLFDNILRAAQSNADPLLRTHKPLFAAIDTLKLSQRTQFHDLLTHAYDIEKRSQLDPTHYRGTLRITVEDLFRRASDLGMLPPLFFNEQKELRDLRAACRYLSGLPTSKELNARSAKQFFPDWVDDILHGVIGMDSDNLHSSVSDTAPAGSPQLYFGYALLLGEVITWFADIYRQQQGNSEAVADNLAQFRTLAPTPDEVNKYCGKEFKVQETDGVRHIKDGLVQSYLAPGTKVRIVEVLYNTLDNRHQYPFYFKVTKL